jgi:subtilisin family serine protease
LGASSGSQQLQNAVDYAWNRGCLVVAAAGNGGSSSPVYPAFYTNCIAVAATDSTDFLASFSQFGSWVDIAAPGVAVLSTIPNNRYASYDGTSMACPHVAGAAAVLWSHNPSLTNAQVRSALETNVDPYRTSGNRFLAPNAGRLNVYRALQAVQPARLQSLAINPTEVQAGQTATGTVTLDRPAPAGGAVVQLSSSNSTRASVPSSVTVPAGATSATFTIQTRPPLTVPINLSETVTITATYGGDSRSAQLRVRLL